MFVTGLVKQNVIPITRLKPTTPNRRALAAVPEGEFINLPDPLIMGKVGSERASIPKRSFA